MNNKVWLSIIGLVYELSYRNFVCYNYILSDRNTLNFSESVLHTSTFASFALNSHSFPARRTCSSQLEKGTFGRLSVKALDHSCVKVHSWRSSFFKRFQRISRFYFFFSSKGTGIKMFF